ncbi:mechanosensitive ion channel family protein [Acidicapsa acidisoli]|uniref:mechanosensitive ion channel family protein n=1 Tax=Acidicapsa acidisoli TaxID=1615681 RepID=UPI0021DF88E7|nr:mechanosensitive ion channel family protein [Acidicapsa acidisoli]
MGSILHIWHGWFFALFLFCGAMVLSNSVHWILFRIIHRKQVESSSHTLGLGLNKHLGGPARAIFIITCLFMALPFAPDELKQYLGETVHQVLAVAMVLSLGWFAVGSVGVVENALLRRFDITAENNTRARQIHTQMLIFRRLVVSFILIVTVGGILWTFHDERIWKAGTGLLASAGIASLILATAAKSTASNFLAGLQIALTSPIRIDDVVVVQGEWGRIEEITSAYVVIKIWDQRRLIVPLTYFIENSFTNWTRRSSDILGTAFLYVDYNVPVEALRTQLKKIAESSPLWDRNVCGLQVTDLKEHTMEIRCLVSSKNSSESFDLRCLVREEMVAFVRDNYPDALPRLRISEMREARETEGAREGEISTQLEPSASYRDGH